jgi:hypothetical protein
VKEEVTFETFDERSKSENFDERLRLRDFGERPRLRIEKKDFF